MSFKFTNLSTLKGFFVAFSLLSCFLYSCPSFSSSFDAIRLIKPFMFIRIFEFVLLFFCFLVITSPSYLYFVLFRYLSCFGFNPLNLIEVLLPKNYLNLFGDIYNIMACSGFFGGLCPLGFCLGLGLVIFLGLSIYYLFFAVLCLSLFTTATS